MNFEFADFPVSYRFSQRGMVIASALAVFVRPVFGPNVDPGVRNLLAIPLVGLVAAALLVSFYVVIRYPYLSLVDAEDGDEFSRHFGLSTWVYSVLKWLAIVTLSVTLIASALRGFPDARAYLAVGYLSLMLAFMVFYAIRYRPESHPTIATLIRATVGIGVLLFPLYIPALAIGAVRCKRLLDQPPVRGA